MRSHISLSERFMVPMRVQGIVDASHESSQLLCFRRARDAGRIRPCVRLPALAKIDGPPSVRRRSRLHEPAGSAKRLALPRSPTTRSRDTAAATAGTFSFRLLPNKTQAGAGPGGLPTEAVLPEPVTVDFDSLPEQYRPLVRTYFELLARDKPSPLH